MTCAFSECTNATGAFANQRTFYESLYAVSLAQTYSLPNREQAEGAVVLSTEPIQNAPIKSPRLVGTYTSIVK